MSADLYPGTLCDLRPRPHVAPRPLCAKIPYTKREAETVRNARLRSHHDRPEHLRVYACTRCGHWHLTKAEHDRED